MQPFADDIYYYFVDAMYPAKVTLTLLRSCLGKIPTVKTFLGLISSLALRKRQSSLLRGQWRQVFAEAFYLSKHASGTSTYSYSSPCIRWIWFQQCAS